MESGCDRLSIGGGVVTSGRTLSLPTLAQHGHGRQYNGCMGRLLRESEMNRPLR